MGKAPPPTSSTEITGMTDGCELKQAMAEWQQFRDNLNMKYQIFASGPFKNNKFP